jgi:hypothetical protein
MVREDTNQGWDILPLSVKYCNDAIIMSFTTSLSNNLYQLFIVAVQKYRRPISIYDFLFWFVICDN